MSPWRRDVPCHFKHSSISETGISCRLTADGGSPCFFSYLGSVSKSSRATHGSEFALPTQPVNQDSSSDNTTSLTPIVDAVLNRLRSLFVREAIVVHPRLLVRKVLQAIPLRARLRVDVHLVVQSREAKPGQIHDLLLESLPTETGELHVLQPPVKLDVLAGADLVGGAADHVGCQQVQRADLVVVAIFVEEAPEATLGLALDFGKLFEGGELEVRGACYGAGDGG